MDDLASLMAQITERQKKNDADYEALAESGGARVWLNGGINNPGDGRKTVITIYGRLAENDRVRILDFMSDVDKWPVHKLEQSDG